MTLNNLQEIITLRRMVNLSLVRKMSESVNYGHVLKTIFEKCVESVKPKSLLSSPTQLELVSPNAIRVGEKFVGVYDAQAESIVAIIS